MKIAPDLRIPFTWQNRHPVFLDRFFYIPNFFDRYEEWEKISWEDSKFFGNSHPVAIEYCSGNGEWIAEKAKAFPKINWVGVEQRFDRAKKMWLRMQRDNLANLFVICGEAITFTKYYVPHGSIQELFVNFPDPWPKPRHAKHRLIRAEFFEAIAPILLDSAKLMITTDDFAYVEQIREVFQSRPDWAPLYFAEDLSDFGASYFSTLWKKKGRKIHHMMYQYDRIPV